MIAFPAEVKKILVRHPGSRSDLGPFLDVVTWVLLVTSFLAVATRLGTKRALRRRIDVDDYLVVGALVCLLCFLFCRVKSHNDHRSRDADSLAVPLLIQIIS